MDEKTTSGPEAGSHIHEGPGCFFCSTAMPVLGRVWNEATRDHFRNSRMEFLKGLRSLIDDRIDHLSRAGEHKGTKVTVE
jgi:hypothetical protein